MHTEMYRIGTSSRTYHKKMVRNCTLTAIVVGFVMLVFMALAMRTMETYYTSQMGALSASYDEEIAQLSTLYESEIETIRTQHNDKILAYDELMNSYNMLKSEEEADSKYLFELGRKYWYVFRDAPNNSGLTMDDIVYQDELAKEKDFNPHIMWCIYDIESDYTVRIDNKISSARGIGQVLASTGRSLYENVLQLGTYSHTLAYDAEVNMTMATELITRNIGSGLYNAIAIYSGDSSGAYYNNVVAMARKHGVSIDDTSYQ